MMSEQAAAQRSNSSQIYPSTNLKLNNDKRSAAFRNCNNSGNMIGKNNLISSLSSQSSQSSLLYSTLGSSSSSLSSSSSSSSSLASSSSLSSSSSSSSPSVIFSSSSSSSSSSSDKKKIQQAVQQQQQPLQQQLHQLQQQKKTMMNNFNSNNKIIKNINNNSISSNNKLNSLNQQQQQLQQQQITRNQFETQQHIMNTSSSLTSSTSTSSSSLSSSSKTEIKAHAIERDLNDLKISMSEIQDLASDKTNSINTTTTTTAALAGHKTLLHTSFEKLIDTDAVSMPASNLSPEPLVTFPEDDCDVADTTAALVPKLIIASPNVTGIAGSTKSNLPVNWQQQMNSGVMTNANNSSNSMLSKSTALSSCSSMNFAEKRFRKESKTQFMSSSEEGFEAAAAAVSIAQSIGSSDMNDLQNNTIGANSIAGLEVESNKASQEIRNKYEMKEIRNGHQLSSLSSSLSSSGEIKHSQARSMTTTTTHQQQQTNTFSMENHRTISQAQQKQSFTSTSGVKHHMAAAQATNFKITSSSSATAGNMIMSSAHSNESMLIDSIDLDDLGKLCSNSSPKEIDNAIKKYSNQLDQFVQQLQRPQDANTSRKSVPTLNNINEIIQMAWTVPTFGHKLGYSLCNALRDSGGIDLLMKNCVEGDQDVKFSSARLLEQCLTIENRHHVVDHGLEKVVNIACVCTKNSKTDHSRIGTGILEHLFKHSEGTCSDVIRLGGLDAVLFECRRNDTETLRHCAGALANLSLYGGAENQEAMISKKVPMWLFPLAFHDDDTVKYYACLAIAALVANKEIEAEVLKSGTLDLVEPFVTTHNPSEFAKSNLSYAHGQSKHWLQRLVPVLNSNREEARNLAAFHFCMEAGIKKEQGCTEIFTEIGAIEPLKTVASCPNAIASKFAAQALRLIGEQVPHKLSQQVPLWSVEDVQEWVKQIGFEEYARNFKESLVDGDLLLQLNENNLREDIGISNGIRRKRFLRELQNLMKMADYSSKDAAKIHNLLTLIGPEYCTYTYGMLNAGVDRETLKHLNDDQLIVECNITNSIHRLRILNALKVQENSIVNPSDDSLEKTLDVFVSYRRSNGSQLASLLKVHLQLRGFSVFIDVERLEAGKFDNNLLNSIRQAKHFILVLTPEALERCIEDFECKDWVHREIVAALNSNCNIIPIIDNFQWPEPEQLPEDMRSVCHFNGVRWIHDYQDACVDKLERFMRGELSNRVGAGSTQAATNNSSQFCDVTAPSTPSTVQSGMRSSHPPNYQRMHSNDSGKLSDKDPSNNHNLSTNSSNSISNNNNSSSSSGNSNNYTIALNNERACSN